MKGEDSAEAKIKSFDEVRAETVQRDFCLFVIKNLFQRFDFVFFPDPPEVQIHGGQSGLKEKKAEVAGLHLHPRSI